MWQPQSCPETFPHSREFHTPCDPASVSRFKDGYTLASQQLHPVSHPCQSLFLLLAAQPDLWEEMGTTGGAWLGADLPEAGNFATRGRGVVALQEGVCLRVQVYRLQCPRRKVFAKRWGSPVPRVSFWQGSCFRGPPAHPNRTLLGFSLPNIHQNAAN